MVNQVSLNGIQGIQSSGNSAVSGGSSEYLNSILVEKAKQVQQVLSTLQ